MLHVMRYQFHEFLFIYFFLPDADVIMTSIQYFVCCITHAFELCLAQHWTMHNRRIHLPVACMTQNMHMCWKQIL